MSKLAYSKILGLVLGTLLIIAAAGYGVMFLIGTGLQQAFAADTNQAPRDNNIFVNLVIIVIPVIIGLITARGPFTLKKTAGKVTFASFCFLLGFLVLVFFFISLGALGDSFEYLILAIGIIYFLLGYLIIKENNLFSREN
ncbi:hypothetical protein QNH20_14910 [Neobacillus sp. WH10]|uniref:hypothetical protein n=1 Tax=Neobacillus sp. WH10 TaxID=3047873 RepID=UPI0024C1904D|nr:hypothetical protein [Neobacillus sp. WH10]WHY75434.1 hypothetical protein QNH20_14910 [Neobacillus sp. WH10]